MRIVPRWYVALFGLLYCLYPVALGLMMQQEEFSLYTRASLLLYSAAIVPTVLFYKAVKLPMLQAAFNLMVAAFIPILMLPQLLAEHIGDYSTWFVGGIASLMGATAFRGHRIMASLGAALLIIQVVAWGGPGSIAKVGVFGVIMFLLAGILINIGLERTMKQTEEFEKESLATAAATAALTAARDEHKSRINAALIQVLPLLQQVSVAKKTLTEQQRLQARHLEAALRDDIRGHNLLSATMKAAVTEARQRGIEVLLLDDGGLDDVDQADRERVLALAADAVRSAKAGQVTVRSPKSAEFKVSVLATRSGTARPDIWLKFS
jgi:hypothetical protein